MIFWLSQVFFACAMISYVFAAAQKQKKYMTLLFVVTNLFFGLHYLCLEKYGTLILLSHEIVLLIALYLFEKYNIAHKYTILACVIVFVLDVNAIILTWTEAIGLLPLSASIVFLISLSFRGVLVTKICMLYTNLSYIVYLSLIGSYVAIICQSALFVSAVIGLLVTLKDLKTKKQISVSRVLVPTVLRKEKLKPSHTAKELLLSNS